VLPVSVRVTRSGENLQAETLYVSSVPGHSNNLYPAASAADGDYFGKIGSTESVVVFEEGQELGFAAFIVRPDNQTEGIEAFRLMLRDDQVNTTSDPLAIQNVFIRDNDSQTPPDDDSGDGGSGGDPGDGGSGGSGGGSADGGSNGVVVRIVDITSPNPTPGGSATVEIEVENTASTTKLVGTLGVYFSEDDTPSRSELVGTYSPGTVAPGDTEDRGVSFVIPDDASGTAKIIVIDQDELNDADQAAIQDFDINTPSNRANLEIGQHYMTDNTLIHGQRVEVEWDVLNTGTADSARSDVSLYLSKGRTFEEDRDIFLTNEFFGTNRNGIQLGIEAGDNDRESEFVTITADMVQQIEGDLVSDEFYLLYVIDEDRVVAESDRSDNVAYSRFSIAADEANLAGYTDHVVTDFNISTDRITFGERFYYDATIENDGRIDVTYGETLANIVWRSVEDGSEEIFGALFTDSNRQYQRNEPQFSSNGYILADGRLEPGYYDVFARVRTDEIERDDLLDNNESNALRVFVGGVDDMPGGTPDPALRDLSVTQSTDQSSVSVSFTAFNSGSGAYSDALIVTIAAVPSSGGNETEIDQLIVPGLLSLGDADGGDILYVSQPDIPLPATLADGEYDIVVYYDNPAGNAVTTNDRLVASSAVVIDADMGDGSGDQDTQEIVVQPGPAAGIDVAVTSVFWTDTNYGRDYELLRTGGWGDWYHSLLQFELPEFEGELVSAEIQLYSPEITDTRFSHDEVELYRVLGPWDESLGYYDTDRPTVEYVSTLAAPSDEAGWYSIDATTLVGDWIDGAIPNFGLQLETPRNDARLNDFYSSDYSVAELRPKLIIQYEPVSVEADRVTLIDEDFDDGVINSAPWIYSTDPQSSVAEVDGYLSLQQAVTDVRSWAQYDFENSIQDANIRFDAFYHDANDRLLATTRLELSASDGEDFTIDFGMVKNPYIGGLDGNPDNYDLPRVKVGDASGTDWYFSSGANTSTFLDQWTAVSIELDNTLGRLFIDVDSDGALEFDIQDDRFIDAELNSLYFNSYGWFTGHYVNIDNLTVTGVETEAADNPTNTAPVASNDVLVLTEDDMISDNVIAGIDGATADSDADGDPLEVVSLRDRDGNPLVLSELNALPEGGQLSVGADGAIDFDPAGDFESLSDGETATVLAEYEISDGTDTDVAQIEITIEGRNNAPVLVDPGPLQITENTADVAVISAFDAEEDSLGFSIEDSADSNLFMIDQSSGALSFVSPPDFEAPSDANGDNIYEIAVSATDSGGLSTTSPLTIAVTDIEESPVTTTDIRTFANGRVLETTFVDGIRVEATMTDVDDVYSWSSYTDTFDADGLRTSRLMQYDDGRTAETNYEAGVRSTVILTDLADEFVWNTVESSYDEEGQISEQVRIYDNERVLETTYVGGNRAEATMTDVGDAYSWTGYTDTFDSDGVRTDRLMQYDDGRIAETAYVSGVRSSSIVDDTGDQFNWKTIEQTFDESGQRDSRTVDYDNGRFMETSYIDGIRSEATMSDLGDVYRWSSYTDSFDFEGTRVSRIMTYDDGEEVVTNYVDDVA
jgi:VCBS repeat-containing protein